MKRTKNFVLLMCCALMMSLASQASAQQGTGNLAESWLVTVKSGHAPEFEVAIKAHDAIRRNHGDPKDWVILAPLTGEMGTRYLIRTCCFSWADEDDYAKWNAKNPAVLQDWYANIQPHVESLKHNFSELDFKHSHLPDAPYEVQFVAVTSWAISPANESDFRAARVELSQVAKNNGWATPDRRWSWSETVGGGTHISLVVPYANYAAMSRGEAGLYDFLAEHMGPDRAGDLLERFAESASGSDYQIWQMRPDLNSNN